MEPSPNTIEKTPEALANLVVRLQRLGSEIQAKKSKLPDTNEAPFLHRQLENAVQHLLQNLSTLNPYAKWDAGNEPAGKAREAEELSPGFLKRIRRSLTRRTDKPNAVPVGTEDRRKEGLQGNSWTVPLPDLIGFLSSRHKTGVLWVHAPNETFLIELRDGNLVHAASDRTPDGLRIGEILIAQGVLKKKDLHGFLEGREKGESPLGTALREQGLINSQELEDALKYQVQQLFHRLLKTENAIFRFQESMQLMLAQHVDLNITQLLLESARVHDEFDHAQLEAALDFDDLGAGLSLPTSQSPGSASDAKPGEDESEEAPAKEEATPETNRPSPTDEPQSEAPQADGPQSEAPKPSEQPQGPQAEAESPEKKSA